MCVLYYTYICLRDMKIYQTKKKLGTYLLFCLNYWSDCKKRTLELWHVFYDYINYSALKFFKKYCFWKFLHFTFCNYKSLQDRSNRNKNIYEKKVELSKNIWRKIKIQNCTFYRNLELCWLLRPKRPPPQTSNQIWRS